MDMVYFFCVCNILKYIGFYLGMQTSSSLKWWFLYVFTYRFSKQIDFIQTSF